MKHAKYVRDQIVGTLITLPVFWLGWQLLDAIFLPK